jgi:hypothetical protein
LPPVFEPDVELGDLGDAQAAQRAEGGLHRVLRRVFPRGGCWCR